LAAVRNRVSEVIDQDKIIVALEMDGLLVDVSCCKREDYSKVDLGQVGVRGLIDKIKESFGVGVYYKPKSSVKTLKIMLQSLSSNPKIDLYLYTHLSLPISQYILDNLCLARFFPQERRRSCSDVYSETLKHPTEIDFNTKRVIIVTTTSADHLAEDSKYFWVLKRGDLESNIDLLKGLIERNKEIEELHNELAELKIETSSDDESW
jgi:hypothetical protein